MKIKKSMTYVPSQEELQRFQELVARLTPNMDLYRNYRMNVNFYLDLGIMPTVSYHGKLCQVTKFRVLCSELFKYDYLLVYVETLSFGEIVPDSDAITSVGDLGGVFQLPLVIIPVNFKIRGQFYRSILEHEFVHVNQILLGTFPKQISSQTAENMLDNFFQCMRSEYEANVLQLTRWPFVFPQKEIEQEISLEHWSVLRGYSQGLEIILADIFTMSVPPKDVVRLIESIQRTLPEMFTRLGVKIGLIPWFNERFVVHIGIAMMNVFKPDLQENKSFIAAALWFRQNSDVERTEILASFAQQAQPILYKILFEG